MERSPRLRNKTPKLDCPLCGVFMKPQPHSYSPGHYVFYCKLCGSNFYPGYTGRHRKIVRELLDERTPK